MSTQLLVKMSRSLCGLIFVFFLSSPISAFAECISGDEILVTKSVAIAGRDGEELRKITESFVFSLPEEMDNIAEVKVRGPCNSYSHQLLFPEGLKDDVFAQMIFQYLHAPVEDYPNPLDIVVVGVSPLVTDGSIEIRIYIEDREITDPPGVRWLTYSVRDTQRAADLSTFSRLTSREIEYLQSIDLLGRLRSDRFSVAMFIVVAIAETLKIIRDTELEYIQELARIMIDAGPE